MNGQFLPHKKQWLKALKNWDFWIIFKKFELCKNNSKTLDKNKTSIYND